MKATTQNAKTTQPPTQRNSHARVQAKVRPSAGNRHRADALERQAEEIAARVIRGEKSLGNRITCTRAAGSLGAEPSVGSLLTSGLRHEMEMAFGADLGAVRIHIGSAADKAAKEYDADAFVSGRNVYFRSGRYSPHSIAGRELIAHELVHVLQQTARVKTGGVLAATDIHGTADIQTKRKSPLATSVSVPTFDEMAERHASASSKDKALTAKIKQIKSEREQAIKDNRLDGYWDNLQQFVRQSPPEYDELTSSQAVRSFIYDTLKLAARWDGAIHLLSRDVDLRTTFFSAEAYENFPEGPVPGVDKADYNDFLIVMWEQHPFFKDFRRKRYYESIRDYLIGPTRAIPDLEAKRGEFGKLTSDKLAERNEPTTLIDNEIFFVAVDVVRTVDKLRSQKLAEFAQKNGKGKPANELTPKERALVASDFAKWAKTLPSDTSRTAEVNAVLNRLIEGMTKAGEEAASFWRASEILLSLSAQDIQLKDIGDVRAGLKKFSAKPEIKKFGDTVTAQTKLLFKLDAEGNPISAAAYSAARDDFILKVREKLYERFEKPMVEEVRSDKPESVLNALLYGWLLLQIYELIELLQKYDVTEDDKVLAEYVKISADYKGADVRIRHRIQVAALLNQLGAALNWTEIQSVVELVFTPAAGEKTLLAIFSDFEKDSSATLDTLTKDLSSSRLLVGGEPLTVGDIRLFFYLQRYKTISADLKSSLDAEKNKPGSQSYGLVKRAFDLGQNLPEPARYTNKSFHAAVRVDDQDLFSPLLRAHPKFLALRQTLTKSGVSPILLTPTSYRDTLTVWALPSLKSIGDLVKRYQSIREFNLAIYEHEAVKAGVEAAKDPDVSSIAQRSWEKWFEDFQAAVRFNYPWLDQNLDPETRQFLMEEEQTFLNAARGARSKLTGEVDTHYAEMVELLKRASIIDREKKSTELNRMLGDYQRYDQFSPGDETHLLRYIIPDTVFDDITSTVNLTQPKEDQYLHQAALLLEISDTMADKFQDSPRLDVMVSYLPLMDEAANIARTKTDLLRSVLTGIEKEDEWISKRAGKLEQLSRLFHAIQQQRQLDFGLEGVVKGPEKYLVGVGEGYVIKPGENFTINGIKYTLVDVLANFTYHPKHGTEPPTLTDANDKPLKLSTPLVELRYGDSTKTVTLRGTDNQDLAELSNAVTLEGIKRQLDDLAVFIQGAAELTMDLVELIPGPGQALMAARLAISILQFVASDEFEVFVDYVTNHPVDALKKFGEEIFALLNPGSLWEYLFFGNNAFDKLHATKEGPKNAKVPRTITGKLVKVIMRLYNFGKGVLGSLGRLQTHSRWRAESLEVFVLSRPTLTWLVRKIADNIDYLDELVGQAVEFSGEIDDYRKKAEAALMEWPTKVIETVDALRRFQLPDEIIPMADIVEIIITMVLKRLPTKFRIASDVIMFLLDKFGKKQALFETIAVGVKEIGVDPNIIWREVRDDYIQKPFQAARNTLAFTIFDFFGQIPTTVPGISPAQFTLLTPDQQKTFQDKAKEAQADKGLEVESVKANDWEAYAPSGIRPGALAYGQLKSAGTQLPADLRRPAEIGLRQNLGHVRLHTGDEAAKFTDSVGAKALAGGSHVFLGNDVNPSTPSGRWILNHELAHVVQQTAPRPFNCAMGNDPVPIPRGRGVVQDSVTESFASGAADAIGTHRSFGLATMPKAKAGIHPFGIIDITRRLLDDLAGTADMEHDEKKEEKTGGSTGLKKLPANVKKQIDKLWETFSEAISSSTKTTYISPFNRTDVQSAIVSLLTNKTDTEHAAKTIEEALGDLAIDSVREKKEAPAKEGEEPKLTYELDVDRLEIALSRFIFAKSGILIRFKLLSGIFQGAATQAKDAPPSFVSLNVVYVHLAEIHGNHKLWQLAVSQVLAGKDHEKYLPRVRTYLEAKGPVLGIWDKMDYQLSKQVIDDVEAIMAATGSTLDKSKLPPPTEYLAPKSPSGAVDNIGLRLGTYGDPQQQGTERESHHITQYLLLEYFHGKADKKPFPLLKKNVNAYPGVSASGSDDDTRANKVAASGAPKPIDLVGWEDGRGGKMPTILISAYTHRTGRLHVTTKADDWTKGGNKKSAPDSPSGVVHMKFLENLHDKDPAYIKAQAKSEGTNTNANQETFPAYVTRKEATSKGGVQKVIYDSMQETYHWMRDFMQPRLETALVTAEMKYYNDLGKDKSYEITASELEIVYAEAVIKNQTEMEKGGWF
jgi:hypothetical protein